MQRTFIIGIMRKGIKMQNAKGKMQNGGAGSLSLAGKT